MAPINSSIILLSLALGLGSALRLPVKDSELATRAPATLWQPAVGTTWQIILSQQIKVGSGTLSPDVAAYDIDLYENTNQGKDTSTIDALHKLGKKVICYFSAGTFEDWREDASQWQSADKGAALPEWKGEKWANLRSDNVAKIIRSRIQLAAKMGCDAIDPDNTDAYSNNGGGLGLTETDTVNFVKNVIVNEAQKYNMAVGLKNSGSVIKQLLPYVQFSVNEQCSEYKECKTFAQFITAGKPVFNIEYPENISDSTGLKNRDKICVRDDSGADMTKFSSVIKKMELDTWVQYCDGKVYRS